MKTLHRQLADTLSSPLRKEASTALLKHGLKGTRTAELHRLRSHLTRLSTGDKKKRQKSTLEDLGRSPSARIRLKSPKMRPGSRTRLPAPREVSPSGARPRAQDLWV